jgi:hypothetical protein
VVPSLSAINLIIFVPFKNGRNPNKKTVPETKAYLKTSINFLFSLNMRNKIIKRARAACGLIIVPIAKKTAEAIQLFLYE